MKNVHLEKYVTNDVDVDVNENLSVYKVLELLQRVTFSHSKIIGLDHRSMIDRDNAFWVITKMKIICNHAIKANQKLTLKTFTREPQAVRFVRDLQIKEKNKLLIRGLSEWCCLDYSSRALRKSNSIKYPMLEMCETKYNKIAFTNFKTEISEKDYVYTYIIQTSDIDVNLHTNNLKYTNIAINTFSLEDLKDKNIKEYEIYFINETKLGDEILVYKKRVKNLVYIEGRCGDNIVFKVVLKFNKKRKTG